MKKDKIAKVSFYLRLSQEKRNRVEDTDSLDNHLQVLNDLAKVNGWEVVGIYKEVLSGSASDMERRPKLEELLANMEGIDAVVVVELSRLSRNGYISALVKQRCIDYNVLIVTPSRTYDLNDEGDSLLYDMESSVNNMEAKRIGKRARNNKIILAREGRHVSSVPYGYRRNHKQKRLEPYEQEAEAVRLIYKWYREGLGCRLIADKLNEQGYKPARVKKFSESSVKKIINNEAYKGTLLVQFKEKVMKEGKQVFKVVDTVRTENAHEAIISPEEWERVQKIKDGRSEYYRTRERPAKEVDSVLRGLLFCKCGRKSGFQRTQKGGMAIIPCQYKHKDGSRCGNAGILAYKLEKSVIDTVMKYREGLKAQLEKIEANDTTELQEEKRRQLRQIDKQLQAITGKKSKLLEYALEELFSPEEIREQKASLANEEQELTSRKERLESQLERLDFTDKVNELKEKLGYLENFERLPVDSQNRILRRIIKRITFTRDIPPEIRKLPTFMREDYPSKIEIEYF